MTDTPTTDPVRALTEAVERLANILYYCPALDSSTRHAAATVAGAVRAIERNNLTTPETTNA